MATLTRTREMFFGIPEAETSKITRWESFVSFIFWLFAPSWVVDKAEDISQKYQWYL